MRLSDIRGERTLEVIAEIIEPIINIAEDKDASELFHREKLPEGMSAKSFLLARARKSVPSLMKGHAGDLIAIFAALEGVEKAKYCESLNLVKLLCDTADLLTDDAFAALFTSAQSGKAGNACGSAPESIEEREA